MTALEICLVVVGAVAVGISYFISEKTAQEKVQNEVEKEVQKAVLSEETRQMLMKQTKDTVENTLNSLSGSISEKAEIQLEKLSNEKIMAVHDYSETVLKEIQKNHSEVMFLYSMLDEKEKELKDTVREVQKTVRATQRVSEEDKKSSAVREEFKVVERNQKSELDERNTQAAALNQKVRMKDFWKGLENQTTTGFETEAPTRKREDDTQEEKKRKEITALYKQGKGIAEIARELGYGVGEVKLVVDLYCMSIGRK